MLYQCKPDEFLGREGQCAPIWGGGINSKEALGGVEKHLVDGGNIWFHLGTAERKLRRDTAALLSFIGLFAG